MLSFVDRYYIAKSGYAVTNVELSIESFGYTTRTMIDERVTSDEGEANDTEQWKLTSERDAC